MRDSFAQPVKRSICLWHQGQKCQKPAQWPQTVVVVVRGCGKGSVHLEPIERRGEVKLKGWMETPEEGGWDWHERCWVTALIDVKTLNMMMWEEGMGGAIIGLQLNTCLQDSAGTETSPEPTAFMALFHDLSTHSHSLKWEESLRAHTRGHFKQQVNSSSPLFLFLLRLLYLHLEPSPEYPSDKDANVNGWPYQPVHSWNKIMDQRFNICPFDI